MGAEQYLLEPWTFEKTEPDLNNPGANVEIMTFDKNVHIAYVGAEFAEHIVRLHNRTFGMGQDPPPRPSAAEELRASRPPFAPLPPLESLLERESEPIRWSQPGTWEAPAPRPPRGRPLRLATSPDAEKAVIDLVDQLVHNRVAFILSREPARIRLDLRDNPEGMADLLRKLGYTVTEPAKEET